MADLRAMCESLGFTGVATLLQSGNVVLTSSLAAATLAAQLEREAERRFAMRVEFVVRSSPQWDALVAGNPFPAEAERDPARLVAIPCTTAPDPGAVDALQAAIVGREIVRAAGTTST
jgi:uncharacterized protein (DUF1697 family)